jgi:hypothetical protein
MIRTSRFEGGIDTTASPKRNDHLYFNISIRGRDYPDSESIPCRFSQDLSESLLKKPFEYHMSVVRFQIPASAVPILIAPIQDYRESVGTVTVPIAGIGRVVVTSGVPITGLEPSDLVDLTGSTTAPNIDGQYEVKQILSPTTFSIDLGVAVVGAGTANFAKVQDPNQMTWSVTLDHNGDIIQKYVRWIPQTTTIPAPPAVTAADPQWPRTRYYMCFSYEHIVEMVNAALAAALADLTAPPAPALLVAPFVYFESDAARLSIILPAAAYLNTVADASRVDLYFNLPLALKLQGFDFIERDLSFGRRDRLDCPNILMNYINIPALSPFAPPQYMRYFQEYVALSVWSDFKQLVFTSGAIPSVPEYSESRDSVSAIAFQPIVTDFEPLFSLPGDSRSELQYFPTGPYRLLDLNGTTDLRKIDIQVSWKDDRGVLRPILLQQGKVATIKLLFIHRGVYGGFL